MQRLIVRITAAVGATLFAVAPVTPAQAETRGPSLVTETEEVVTAAVSFADLDLSSEAGRKRLDARLRHAVKQVCPTNRGWMHETLRSGTCKLTANAEAADKIAKVIALRR